MPITRAETIGHWLSDRVIRALIALARALPYGRRVPVVGWLTARVIAPLAGYQTRAMENLRLIYPDMTASERRRIARAVADNVGRTLIENYSIADLMARMQGVEPRGPGFAALQDAQANGRPVILVSGHFGNYEAARAALVGRGYQVGGLYRPMRNPYFNRHYVATMESFGGPVFPQGRRGTGGFVRHLRTGGAMVLLIDQHQGRGAVLEFLGQPAQTALSAAELALKFDALLIPFYATRQADGLSFAIDLEAPIDHGDAGVMTQALNDSLAARVRRDPEQWFWIHRRWKVSARKLRKIETPGGTRQRD